MYESSPERRKHLVQFNQHKIQSVYFNAVKAGIKQPIALVLDLLDPDARQIASALQKGKTVEDVEREAAAMKDAIPTLYAVLPKVQLLEVLRVFQNVLHQMDSENPPVSPIYEKIAKLSPPPGMFFVVCISSGKQLTLMSEPHGLVPASIEIDAVKQPIFFGQSRTTLGGQ